MALSRRDVGRDGRITDADGNFTETIAQFHARWDGYERDRMMHLYSDDRRLEGPARAFFHPGVGLWQLDDAGGTQPWVKLNHGQRADTGLGRDGLHDSEDMDSGGEVVAKLLAGKYCETPGGIGEVEKFMKHWHACKPARCIDVYNNIYLDNSDDLYVTTGQDEGLYSTTGGAGLHQCRWSDTPSADPIPCAFYDTENPQGWTDTAIPATTARPPDTGGLGSNPYALPFIAFTHDDMRFAVFPDRILYPSADSIDSTRYKAVPEAKNARRQANTWTTGAHGGAVLQVHVCDEPEWVISGEGRCDWLDAGDARFASLTGVRHGN